MKLFKLVGSLNFDKVLYFENSSNNLYVVLWNNDKLYSVNIGKNKWQNRKDCKMVYL